MSGANGAAASPAGTAPLSRQENQLRIALWAGAALFAAEAALYVPSVFEGPSTTRPFAINSVAKDVVFCLVTAAVAADVRRRARLLWLVIIGHLVIVGLLALTLIFGDTAMSFPPPRWLSHLLPWTDIPAGSRTVIWLIGAVIAVVALLWLLHRALSVRYDLKYLWPAEHATLAATADAILDAPRVAPEQIATRVDHYWASLDIGYKLRLRLALWVSMLVPLLFGHAPLPVMERAARRRFIARYFIADIGARRDFGPLRSTVQSCTRFVMQLVYMGYYDDPRSYADTGYVRFSNRPSYPGPPPAATPLRTLKGKPERRRAEVVIIGTGAGGSVVAHELADAGHDVLMLERGRHVSPQDFVEDEAAQYARLYSDGALQLSRDFSFQVLQGMCVGGSTVVNNGVCFDVPDAVLDRWSQPDLDAALPRAALADSFTEVRKLIGVENQAAAAANPIVGRLGGAPLVAVDADLHDCIGCGYCNIGCAYGRKLSMLATVLPQTQHATDARRERDPSFRGRLEIVPECEVTAIRHQDGRVTGVKCSLRGSGGELEVDADAVVLAAGAIHSSRILMASRIGGSIVGRGLSANLGSHMTAHWGDGPPLRAFEGLQMSHYLNDGDAEHMVETWFNPLMSQAVVMPGWLGDHQQNMRRYDRLGCLGVLVGSTRDGNRVTRSRDLISGAEINFTPSTGDLDRLLTGLRHAGRLMLDAGADCVMPATFLYHELRTAADLERLRIGGLVKDASDISVNTAHPQGGNPISARRALGVVDDRLRVHGYSNLHVCDASVFPTAITVNPQLTVMALAHYAAQAMV
ncbi:MAG: GMC family oxidoreductase N-terminal domain-containing protein [Solirubrobacteraceae bacterium]